MGRIPAHFAIIISVIESNPIFCHSTAKADGFFGGAGGSGSFVAMVSSGGVLMLMLNIECFEVKRADD